MFVSMVRQPSFLALNSLVVKLSHRKPATPERPPNFPRGRCLRLCWIAMEVTEHRFVHHCPVAHAQNTRRRGGGLTT